MTSRIHPQLYKPMWSVALSLLLLLLVAAFGAASLTLNMELLSLVPPPTASDPNPVADVVRGQELALYQSAYTGWVGLVLLAPVYIAVWFRNLSATSWSIWLTFWTVSYVAYIVHIFWAMFVFFDGDFGAMISTSRVSAFWPGMVLIFWWAGDIFLALSRGAATTWITRQRVVLHLLTFALFFWGSAITGELIMVQILGYGLAIIAVGSMIMWALRRVKP